MKYLSLAGLLLLAISPRIWAAPPVNVFNAEIKGTIARQVLLSANEGRIEVERLDEKRIFQEFLLSREQYALVLDVAGAGQLLFRGKSAAAALPDVPVLDFGDGATVINTKSGEARLERAFTSTSTDTVFKNLGGTGAGVITFDVPFAPPLVLKKVVMRFTGHGTDEVMSPAGEALLKFKLSTTSRFEQAP